VLFAVVAACGAPSKSPPEPVTPSGPVAPVPPIQPNATTPAVPEPEPAHPWEAPDFRTATSRGGAYTVKWRPTRGAEVPKNEHFELEAWLFRGPGDEDGELTPVPGVRLIVSGWMPEHGHGMIRQPQAIDQGDGSYLVRGMLFHMGGHWQLFFDVIEDGLSERVDFELDL